MVVLQANQLAKSIGVKQIFSGVGFVLRKGERTGLVGVNGAGKTTLLRILAGLDRPDEGEITKGQSIRVGYLAQHFKSDFVGTVWEMMMEEFAHLAKLKEDLAALEGEMASPQVYGDQALLDKTMARYSELTHTYETAGGYSCESRVRGILTGLGFGSETYARKVTEFSGGQQTRLALARLLLNQPEVLLLDEPTNHLDITTVEWLEDFLQDYPGAVLLVSHDRYFLDKTVGGIFEMEGGRLKDYPGNFSRFQVLKAQQTVAQEKEYLKQQAKIARLEAYIERFRAGIKSKQARGRQSQLDRLPQVEAPVRLKTDMDWNLQPKKTSGQVVVTLEQVAVGYNQPLSSDLTLQVKKGEKVGLIGANGTGKSTILKTITGQLPTLEGKVCLGSQVTLGYFAQDSSDSLHPQDNLIQAVQGVEAMNEGAARNFLGNFLFTGDDVFKQVTNLSGGEKARLVLALLFLRGDNFLLLDEPTNHLDMQAREVLEEGISQYEGTVLVVSHDRYFLDQTVTRILDLNEQGKLTEYLGDYTYYRWKKQQLEQQQAEQALADEIRQQQSQNGSQSKSGSQSKGQQAQVKSANKLAGGSNGKGQARPAKVKKPSPEQLEAEISKVEARMAELSQLLADPETYKSEDGGRELTAEYQDLELSLQELYEEWESIIC